jgi:D-glycero-alpha-D-manno-heptose-7-phosphate kinase
METLDNQFVISRTPYRLSFVGGGSDYPSYYRNNKGAVLATSINRYCYILVRLLPPFFEHKYLISYSDIERVRDISEIRHPSVREVIRFVGIKDGIDLHYAGDLPARSGMGSSSVFTVGLLNALYELKGIKPSNLTLGLEAIHVEQNIIKEQVGSQDQTTSAIGGFNRLDFAFKKDNPNLHDIKVTPIKNGKKLENYLLLFFTGLSRTASVIAKSQLDKIESNYSSLKQIYDMVDEGEKILNSSNIEIFGKLLYEYWQLKKTLSNEVSTEYIDYLYDKALKAGATGGKLCGAGGGGFLLLFVEPDKQPSVKKSLAGLINVPVKFESGGSQIIYGSRFDREI